MYWNGTHWVNEAAAIQPARTQPRRRMRDLLATLPILLLIPALLLPFVSAGATIDDADADDFGRRRPGGALTVSGSGFESQVLDRAAMGRCPDGLDRPRRLGQRIQRPDHDPRPAPRPGRTKSRPTARARASSGARERRRGDRLGRRRRRLSQRRRRPPPTPVPTPGCRPRPRRLRHPRPDPGADPGSHACTRPRSRRRSRRPSRHRSHGHPGAHRHPDIPVPALVVARPSVDERDDHLDGQPP